MMYKNKDMLKILSLPPKQFMQMLDEISNELNKKQKSNAGRPKKDIDLDIILSYKSQGLSNREIGRRLNIPSKTIDRRVNQLKKEGYL